MNKTTCQAGFLSSLCIAVFVACMGFSESATAQSSQVTFVIGLSAGGTGDLLTRALAKAFGETNAVETRVENISGNAGEMAAERFLEKPADGAFVLMHSGYFTSDQGSSLVPLAEVGWAPLGVWRGPGAGKNATLAFNFNDRASAVLAYSGEIALKSIVGEAPSPAPHKGEGPALQAVAATGGWFVGGLHLAEVAKKLRLQLMATSSPALASYLGVDGLHARIPWPCGDFVSPWTVYVAASTPPAIQESLRAKLEKAITGDSFISASRARAVVATYRAGVQARMAIELAQAAQSAIQQGAPLDSPGAGYRLSATNAVVCLRK